MSAALALRDAGERVEILDFDQSLRYISAIGKTPLNGTPTGGYEWTLRAESRLNAAGVEFGIWRPRPEASLDSHPDPAVEPISIYCPCGEAGAPHDPMVQAHDFYKRTLCFWAPSDAYCFRGTRLAVLGSRYSALDQACILAEHAMDVVLLCPAPELRTDADLLRPLASERGVRIWTNSSIAGLTPDDTFRLKSITVRRGDRLEEHLFQGLFPLDPVHGAWHWYGGYERALEAARHGRLYVAGIAAGVSDGEHAAQWEDGARAAGAALSGQPDTVRPVQHLPSCPPW